MKYTGITKLGQERKAEIIEKFGQKYARLPHYLIFNNVVWVPESYRVSRKYRGRKIRFEPWRGAIPGPDKRKKTFVEIWAKPEFPGGVRIFQSYYIMGNNKEAQ